MTEEEKAVLQAENARLAADLAASRAQIAAASAAQAHTSHLAFCEDLVSQGRLLPAWREMAVATLDHFATHPAVVEFGEGEAKAPLPDAFKAMLTALPVQVNFGESATAANAAGAADTVSYAEGTDPARIAQDKAIRAHMAEHKTDYASAAFAVLQK